MTVKRVGIDIGFGYSKLGWFGGDQVVSVFKSLIVPSVLGRGTRVQQMDLGLGGPVRRRVFRVAYKGDKYLVGADALLHSQTGLMSTQSFGRIGSDEERILLLTLLAKAGLRDVAVVTGLPVLAWDLRRKLKKSWTGRHEISLGRTETEINIREVRTVWQPVLSLYDRALVFEGGRVKLASDMDNGKMRRGFLVVDVGHNTTDRAGVINLVPVDRLSGGARVGGRDILAVIQKTIEAEYGIHRYLHQIEQALREGYMDVYSDRVDLMPLARSASASLSAQVASDVADGIGDGSEISEIILTGGPAGVVKSSISRACPKNSIFLLPDSQLGNVRGAAKWGQGPVFKTEGEW